MKTGFGPQAMPPPIVVIPMSLIQPILQEFLLPGDVQAVERHGTGHINDTFRVVVSSGLGDRTYLLQRLNPSVFPRPHAVMANIQAVTAHLNGAILRRGLGSPDRAVPQLVTTREGAAFVRDARGGTWRLFRFVDGTVTRDHADTEEQARQAGLAYGRFHLLLSDFEGELETVLPGFHDTPARLAALERVAGEDAIGRLKEVRHEVDQLLAAREEAGEIERLRAAGALPVRVAHHDAKVSNVLFDQRTGEGICVVDLDTVMTGTVLYDIGDLIRSVAASAAEDEPEASMVQVRPTFVDAALRGFLEEAGDLLETAEKAHLQLAGRIITMEQAARFLTDYLQGDSYYPVTRASHNLDRARVQLRIWEGLAGG